VAQEKTGKDKVTFHELTATDIMLQEITLPEWASTDG